MPTAFQLGNNLAINVPPLHDWLTFVDPHHTKRNSALSLVLPRAEVGTGGLPSAKTEQLSSITHAYFVLFALFACFSFLGAAGHKKHSYFVSGGCFCNIPCSCRLYGRS